MYAIKDPTVWFNALKKWYSDTLSHLLRSPMSPKSYISASHVVQEQYEEMYHRIKRHILSMPHPSNPTPQEDPTLKLLFQYMKKR